MEWTLAVEGVDPETRAASNADATNVMSVESTRLELVHLEMKHPFIFEIRCGLFLAQCLSFDVFDAWATQACNVEF